MPEPHGARTSHRGTRGDPADGGVRAVHRRARAVDAHVDLRRALAPDAPRACAHRRPHALLRPPPSTRCRSREQAGLVAHEVLHVALRHPQRYLELQRAAGRRRPAALQHLRRCHRQQRARAICAWLELPARARCARGAADARAAPEHGGVETARCSSGTSSGCTARSTTARRRGERQVAAAAAGRRDGPRPRAGARRRRARAAACQRPMRAREDADAADLLAGELAAGLRPRTQAEAAREWSERLLRAHAGDGAVSRCCARCSPTCPRTRTPWEQVLRTRLARGAVAAARRCRGRGRRAPTSPTRAAPGAHGACPGSRARPASRRAPRLALIVDVSGSIDDALLERFAREIEAITRRTEGRRWCW